MTANCAEVRACQIGSAAALTLAVGRLFLESTARLFDKAHSFFSHLTATAHCMQRRGSARRQVRTSALVEPLLLLPFGLSPFGARGGGAHRGEANPSTSTLRRSFPATSLFVPPLFRPPCFARLLVAGTNSGHLDAKLGWRVPCCGRGTSSHTHGTGQMSQRVRARDAA